MFIDLSAGETASLAFFAFSLAGAAAHMVDVPERDSHQDGIFDAQFGVALDVTNGM
jgi:hypothetical protein